MHFLHDEDPSLWNPPSPDTILWRYMSFAKLAFLLARRADGQGRLFFTRCDRFEDENEGAITAMTLARREAAFESLGEPKGSEFRQRYEQFMIELPQNAHASCWHENSHESQGQWNLYGLGEGGVAIKTTSRRLLDSVSAANQSSGGPIFGLARVRYIDYEKDDFRLEPGQLIGRLFHKRPEFASEREVRLIHSTLWTIGPTEPPDWGIEIPCDAQTLVETIVVRPRSPDWVRYSIASLLKVQDYEIPVVPSRLDETRPR